jgi:uncharacterized protein with von Willebrand factor type A (vWA) domain
MQPDSGEQGGRILANLLRFGRLLRQVGIPVGTAQVYDLARGLEWIDLGRREDFYHAACGCLVRDVKQLELFDRAFDLFWAGQVELLVELGRAGRIGRSRASDEDLPQGEGAAQRSRGALAAPPPDEDAEEGEPSLLSTYSPLEILYHKDFSHFSAEEIESARRLMQGLTWRLELRRTRRKTRSFKRTSYLDLRRAMRTNLAYGGEMIHLSWRRRKTKPCLLVLICDISGSMERYSRLLLHFMYTLVQGGQKIETFVFGTRLTSITAALRHRDAGAAIDQVSHKVVDWCGGTRIGESLKAFNYGWSRRVLGHGAVVIIISDGWDRGDQDLLRHEIIRLKRSAARLIWLNPLAGAPDYQPLVGGIQTVLPYVDEFLPLHNLASLGDLVVRLSKL